MTYNIYFHISHVNYSRFMQHSMFMFIGMGVTRWKKYIVSQQVKSLVRKTFYRLIIRQDTTSSQTNLYAKQINNICKT